MVNTYLIVSAIIAIIAVALGAAYTTGALDPVVEKIGVMFFKAKAKAEEKAMEAKGKQEGEDFLASEFSCIGSQNIYADSTRRSTQGQPTSK